MTSQSEIDRLARLSPETLRAALIVAETRRVRIKRSEYAAMSEGERGFSDDELHHQMMERASARFLIALRSGRTKHRDLIWTLRDTRPESAKPVEHRYPGVALAMAEKDLMRALAVKRDPCVHCGVTGDKHAVHGCRRYAA